MFCPRCGTNNGNGAIYCVKCGLQLPVYNSDINKAPVSDNSTPLTMVYKPGNNGAMAYTSDMFISETIIDKAKRMSQVSIGMSIVSLVSIIAGIFNPLLWVLVFALPIPTIICSIRSNGLCKKYKNQEVLSESVKKIFLYNRWAKAGAILTVVLTILLLIAVIGIVILVGVNKLEGIASALDTIF